MGLVLNLTIEDEISTQGILELIQASMFLVEESLIVVDDFISISVVKDYIEAIEDGFAINVNALNNTIAVQSIIESFTNTDSSLPERFITVLVDENLEIQIVGDIKGIFASIIMDALDFLPENFFDVEPYLILSLDTERLLPAIHSLPFFNSFIEFDGEIYGSNKDGLFKLAGDTDQGQTIHTGVVWNKTSFGFPHKKRIRTAIIDGIIGSTVMQVTTDSGSAICVLRKNRIPVGRNLYGRDWEVRLAEFERLESFELIPVLLRR